MQIIYSSNEARTFWTCIQVLKMILTCPVIFLPGHVTAGDLVPLVDLQPANDLQPAKDLLKS